MPSYNTSNTICYVAWDTVANAGKTGDAGNHTLRWVKDGSSAAPTNSPSEVDSTNAPGVYKIVLTGGECNASVGTICGKSATAGVAIIPKDITFERLPGAFPAAAGGLLTYGTGTGQINPTGGKVATAGALPRNAALAGFSFFLPLSSDGKSPAVGKSVTARRKLDGGAFVACANAVTEAGGGYYQINLAATDTDGASIVFEFSATGCDNVIFNVLTTP